ncbi:nucleotidyltransferase family protein [Variovorax humicola]|uniref:nucleotidyltransferase family protein n=1 Tax=Variovorax humicola TaxID=1769758 RepID=UPI003BF52453
MSLPPEAAARFIQDALRNDHNRVILERMPLLALLDAWLVAGCLFQTVWNLRAGRAPTDGIRDYDLFYFDPSDLSEAAERAVGARVQALFEDRGIVVEAKNQARVHTWYADWFGHDYPALTCARDGIDRFLVAGTCVALQPGPHGPTLYAPHGLDAIYNGLLAPNPLCNHRMLYLRKAADYAARWPGLRLAKAT